MRNKVVVFALATAGVIAFALVARPGASSSDAEFTIVGEDQNKGVSESEMAGLEEALAAPQETPAE